MPPAEPSSTTSGLTQTDPGTSEDLVALTPASSRPDDEGKGGGESVGYRSGRRIVELKRTKKADLTDDDYAHMKKVVSYVHRHLAQGGPAKDKEHSDWRYSLMNWGHDPLK